MNVVELEVEGMTCAACAARIEKNLNRLDGVEASVNLATEKATVRFDPSRLALDNVLERIRDTGYDAHVAREGEIRDHTAELARSRRDFLVAALFTAPFLIEMGVMFSGGHGWMPGWVQWLLATPVQFWSGRRFYHGAWKALRGGTANMDVLVALGTSVAYVFSAAVVAFRLENHVYFEAAAVVITLVLLGKYLEARAKAKAAQSLEALIRLQPSTCFVEKDGKLVEIGVETLEPGDAVRRASGRCDRGRRPGCGRRLDGERIDAHRREPAGGEAPRRERFRRHRERRGRAQVRGRGDGQGYRARRHHPPGRRRAGLQAPGAASGGQGVRRLRPRGARDRARHFPRVEPV